MQLLHSNFVVYLIQSKEILSFRKSFKQPIQPPFFSLNHHFISNRKDFMLRLIEQPRHKNSPKLQNCHRILIYFYSAITLR